MNNLVCIVASSTNSEKTYEIRSSEGVLYCGCPAWKFSRPENDSMGQKNCKHLRGLRLAGLRG